MKSNVSKDKNKVIVISVLLYPVQVLLPTVD